MNRLFLTGILAFAIVSLHSQDHERITKYIPSSKPDRIILNIAGDPATSMAVTWRTDTTITESVAQVTVNLPTVFLADSALTVSGYWQDVTGDGVTGRFHSVIFSGLKPSTGYAYRVGSGAEASEWFTFRTAAAGTAPLTFLYFGDSQLGSKSLYARVIRQAYRQTPDARLMIFAGDLVDGGSGSTLHDDEWGDWHAAAGFTVSEVPVMPTPGNHEYYDPAVRGKRDLNRYWRAGFTLPENGPEGVEETAYSVDYQGVRFIIVNSDEMVRNESLANAQAEWVEGLLRNNPCKWTVVVFHHPVYSTSARRDNKVIRESLKPLFDRYGVDLVLTGHDHTYARGMIVPDSADMKVKTAGTVYVVSVSGSKQYKQDAKQWWQVGMTNTQLWQAVTVDGDRLSYRAYDATGRVADQFTITRMKDGRKKFAVQPPKE
ncbi:MAG TPA: metallophosphoesterase [Bacteroidales bacterium]|nr:metallophosphoesterase [Bacteroidales bacterium]